jgi:nitrite reductase (NADH) small subunit
MIPLEFKTVCKVSDISNDKAFITEINGTRIGIFKFRGGFYAYENECAHQGGPVCEGEAIGNTEAQISPDGRNLSEFLSSENINISCPWHGVEYDILTGECRSRTSLRLTSHEVKIEGDSLLVALKPKVGRED